MQAPLGFKGRPAIALAPRIILSLVVAVAENGVIGHRGALPWRMPSDLRTFRRLTLGKPVVMGRRTFQSIGRPLDGRDNIVVTRDAAFHAAGVRVAATLEDAIDVAHACARERGADEIAIIGGGEIYRAALALADRIYLTRVHAAPEGDATFPELNPATWHEASRTALARDARDDHAATLVVLERRSAA